MGMNFTGKPLSNQFLYGTMVREVYDEHEDAFEKYMEAYAADLQVLATTGIWNTDRTLRMWCCHIGTKGDLPALVKLGGFRRTFRHLPKAASSRTDCGGICHLCMAGREGPHPVPFEDLRQSGEWTRTLFEERPWPDDKVPAAIQGVPLQAEQPEDFFRVDLWHCFHAGVGKVWVAAALAALQEVCNNDGSVDGRLAWMTRDWRRFCREKKICPGVKEINRATLSWPQASAWPLGHWTKGQSTTHLCMYVQDLCERFVEGWTDDALLLAIVPWRPA